MDVDALIKDIKRYLPFFHEQKFLKAVRFAANAHRGQQRKSGEQYIIHPFETVKILTSLHVDEDTLIAALLHDVPEDTPHPISEISAKFGKKVAFLVDGITKLAKVHYQNDMAKRQIESLKKLFIHTAKDPRIIIIKLADRLHNMRTLDFIDKPEKKQRIARETLEIFVPIANLLGIEELKTELEDLCFKVLNPGEFQFLVERTRINRDNNKGVMAETLDIINSALKKINISASVYGRTKNLYSIYKRVGGDMTNIHEYDNLIPLRIIVGSTEECYKVLGIIHSIFKPKPGKFKDYIAVPKRNGYQSLHTVVFGQKGVTTEIQIRTNQMHLEAEYGIASHYFFGATTEKSFHLEDDKRAKWANKIIQAQQGEESHSGDKFMEDLKLDILHDRIFVFTPSGDSIDLPLDATCIDFAYEIHTEVGNRAIRADLNGKIVPMTMKLKNGDTVNIITSDTPKGPSRAWLAFIKTNTARTRILEYFKKTSRGEKISTGSHLLQKELDRAGLGLTKDISQKKIKSFTHDYKTYKDFDEILVAIGEGTLSPLQVVNEIYPQIVSAQSKSISPVERRIYSDEQRTPISLRVISIETPGQLRKILAVFDEMDLLLLKTRAYISRWGGKLVCKLIVGVRNYSEVSELCENLEQVVGVKRVERLIWKRKLFFILGSSLTFSIWAAHPFVLHYVTSNYVSVSHPILSGILMYTGIFMLFLMVLMLKSLTHRSLPELRETSAFWALTFLLSTFALITLFAEIYFFELAFNWVFVLGLILLIFAYLTSEYITYRDRI